MEDIMITEADNTRNLLAFLSTEIPNALSKFSFLDASRSTLMSSLTNYGKFFINKSFRHVAAIYERAATRLYVNTSAKVGAWAKAKKTDHERN
jgi:hypothetical protein